VFACFWDYVPKVDSFALLTSGTITSQLRGRRDGSGVVERENPSGPLASVGFDGRGAAARNCFVADGTARGKGGLHDQTKQALVSLFL